MSDKLFKICIDCGKTTVVLSDHKIGEIISAPCETCNFSRWHTIASFKESAQIARLRLDMQYRIDELVAFSKCHVHTRYRGGPLRKKKNIFCLECIQIHEAKERVKEREKLANLDSYS